MVCNQQCRLQVFDLRDLGKGGSRCAGLQATSMRKHVQKMICSLLAVFMIFCCTGYTPLHAADSNETANVQAEVQLQNAEVVIKTGDDEATVKQKLYDALVVNKEAVSDPQSLEWEYYCTGKNGLMTNDAWGSISGFTSEKKVVFVPTTFTHPALAANADGDYQVRLKGTTQKVTLSKKDHLDASITLNEGTLQTTLVYNDDLQVDYDALRTQLFAAMVASTTPQLTADDVTFEYYAEATSGSVGSLGKNWVALEGGTVAALNYPAMGEGTHEIRISYAGNEDYSSASVQANVVINERPQADIVWNETPQEIALAYQDDQSIDYAATETAIINALIASAPEDILDEVQVEYNATLTGWIDQWKPLDNKDVTNFKKFGIGTWEVRISWSGNKNYSGFAHEATITVADHRTPSAIVCNSNASIAYNMDTDAMKQQIIDEVIDWNQSALPSKESLSADDFTIEYYATQEVTDTIEGLIKNWAPIEGGTVVLVKYPAMGAGDQKIRITFKGNSEYRPSETAESSLNVKKAKVSVTVHSTNIYADESVPADFVTTDPQDNFNIYTIYAGVTSNVTTSLYLQLPARYSDNAFLKIIDPIVKSITGQSFSELLQEGVTVGQLREIFSTQELLNALDVLGIDTGSIGQLLTALNNMPSIADSLRISFGTPNHAGLYTVAAVTDNKNYETGVGIGALLVKMRADGVKLHWNQDIPNGKLSEAQAANFDFGVTLYCNGSSDIKQSNVHYLYTGFTTKWKLYSSTTTPPREAGSYIVTVVTLGGDYQAAPITRTFTITK